VTANLLILTLAYIVRLNFFLWDLNNNLLRYANPLLWQHSSLGSQILMVRYIGSALFILRAGSFTAERQRKCQKNISEEKNAKNLQKCQELHVYGIDLSAFVSSNMDVLI